jgi:hypothetical protein
MSILRMRLIRNVVFFVLAALFAVLLYTAFFYGPGSVLPLLPIAFGISGLVVVILTARLEEAGVRKLFFILTGASAPAIPLTAILHNFIFEGFFFVLALFVFPALFVIGWLGSVVLMGTSERQISRLDGRDAVMLLPALMIALVAAVIVALFMGSGKGETYSVTSELVNAPDEEIHRVYVTAEVEEALMPVFWRSFEYSLVSAFESNGVDATFELIREADGSAGTDEDIEVSSSDATMHISIDALYRTHRDGYEAIVGTVFEVTLTDAKTGERAWHLSGKVDYIAEKFFNRPGYRAPESVRKEFAWNTTAAIVRTYMVDIKGQLSAPIYTVTEARDLHGQWTHPVYAEPPTDADSIVDRWNCQLNNDKTPADLVAASSVWLKAAKSNEGGEDLEAFLEFPIEADTGDDDFTIVLVFADRKTWDTFYHDYPNSPAGKAEKAWGEVATCTGASVWASVEIE